MHLFCEHTALLQDGKIVLVPALLNIEAPYIQSVQEWHAPLSELPPQTRILKNQMLTPAFVNAHTHLAMSFFRAIDSATAASGNMITDLFFKLESHMTAEDVRAFTRMGAYECLFFGVGTVWDHYYHGEAIAQGLSDVGLTGVVAPTLQDLEGPGKDSWEREWAATENIHRSQALAARGIVAAWGPHATDTVSSRLWTKIHEAASQTQLPIHAHLAQTREEFLKHMSRENLSPVKFLARLGIFEGTYQKVFAHGVYLRDEDLQILAKQSQQTLIFCPFSQMVFDFPANVTEWQKYRIPWAVATDTVASNDSMNVQKELRYVSGFPLQGLSFSKNYSDFRTKHNSLAELTLERQAQWQTYPEFRDPAFLLSKVWQVPGQIHPQLKVGVINANAFANLIIWDLASPVFWPARNLRALGFSDVAPAIVNMMLGGQWVSSDGTYTQTLCASPAYKAALAEGNRRVELLLKRK